MWPRVGLDRRPAAVRTIGGWEGLPGVEPPYAAGVSWLSRTGARIAARELRDSWPRASVRALIVALVVGGVGDLVTWVFDGPWVYVAVRCALVTLFYMVLIRWGIRLDAWSRARRG